MHDIYCMVYTNGIYYQGNQSNKNKQKKLFNFFD